MAKRSEFYRLYLPKISRFDLFFVDLGLQEHFSGLMSQAKPCSETERKPVRDFRLR